MKVAFWKLSTLLAGEAKTARLLPVTYQLQQNLHHECILYYIEIILLSWKYIFIFYSILFVLLWLKQNSDLFLLGKWFKIAFCLFSVFLEQNFVYFLSRTMAKQNLDSFFVSQKDFESNVAFFLFRKNRQNSDKTAVCFVCLLLGEILFCSE
jgi:predicted membrane protein